MKPRLLTHDGVTQSITDWALDYGITPDTITRRLRIGWPVARAITTPIPSKPGDKLTGAYLDAVTAAPKTKPKRTKRRRTSDIYLAFNGHERSLNEWATLTGIKHATLRWRHHKGWPVANVLFGKAGTDGMGPGVAFDFGASEGTGGGTAAQDSPNITFSKKAVNA
jgi:hypothetical protein